MLNFEEELQKFTPIMEVDDIEDALYQESFTDTEEESHGRRRTADQEDRRR